ncbi:MAG: dTMP kinase [Myxococcota bacterium]
MRTLVLGGNVNSGILIVFEGLDGCGKSTQLTRAAATLRARDLEVVLTREPTDGVWGRRIREMARSDEPVAPETELEWFFEDRREHMRDVVCPALEAGKIVLSDRSYISTVAYQGARGLDPAEILSDSEAEFAKPDCVLLFELAPKIGLGRVAARGGVLEPAFENLEFQERVAEVFAQLDQSLGVQGVVRIDADRSEDAIEQDVRVAIDACLAEAPSRG